MMTSALRFLVAARQGEIAELTQLGSAIELTRLLGQLVHELQRERGASNVFLTSGGAVFAQERQRIIAASDAAVAQVRHFFDQLDAQASFASSSRARLFNRIAYALHGLHALQGLREQVESTAQARTQVMDIVAAYTQLIASLLAVIFEAADSATDADISRQLVAYFNFIQSKELAGQERAIGVLILSGDAQLQEEGLQHLLNLMDGQERSLQTFASFSDAGSLSVWNAQEVSPVKIDLDRQRHHLMARGTTNASNISSAQADVPSPAGAAQAEQQGDWSVQWFDCCTRRIDGMKGIEDRLTAHLQALSEDKIRLAQQDLANCEAQLAQLAAEASAPGSPAEMAGVFFENLNAVLPQTLAATTPTSMAASNTAPYGPHLERATLEMLQVQERRLQAVSDELEKIKSSLHERKFIDRAKGLLMQHRQVTEDIAYKMLRDMAMQQNRRLIDVARSVIALESYLGGR